jgi:PAS domain S-box-containing protein
MRRPRSFSPTETATQASDGITPEQAALSNSSPAHRAVEAAQIGTWEWRLASGRVEWSPQADTIFGLAPGDFSGTFEGFLSLVHPSDRAQLQAAIQTAIETSQPYHLDHRIITPGGIIRWVSCRGRAVQDSDGHVAGMAGTTEDITRRKETELTLVDLQETLEQRVRERTAGLEQAVRNLQEEIERRRQTEAALKASEQRYHALYEHNPTMYFTLTPDGTVLSVNRFGAEELGYREDELVGQSVLAVFQAADHHTVMGQLIACSQSPGRTFDWEIQKVRKGGQLLWVKERARAITGPDGSPIILIVCEDITEQRQTQELIRDRDQQLQATTQFLHTLVQESPLPIVSLDAEARVTSWNQAATRLFGWMEEEVLGRELPYVPPGQETEADALWNHGTRHGIRGPLSLRRQRKDGKLLDLLLWPVFIENPDGRLSTAVGLYVDQSDLRQAEDARLHSEERLRSFLNALDDLAFEFDDHGTYLNVWTRNEDILLLPKEEIVGKTLADLHGKEAGERYRHILTRVLNSGQPEAIEYSLTIHGQLRHFSAILSRIPASASTPSTVACVVRDITEQKRSAEALHLSEHHLKSIIETSPECVKLVAADGTLLQMNTAGLAMIEAGDIREVLGQCVYPIIAEPHREAFRTMNERVCRGQKESLEFEVVGLRGTRRWMETHAVPLRNPADGAMVQLAITRDITDRKQALADRERISQDLHDNLLQSLYAVGMQLEAGKLLVGKAPRKSKQHVTQAIRQLNHLVLEVRQFITDLTRRTAPTLDFSVALNQLVASCSSETRTAPELDLDPTALTVVTPTIGEQLLSIAREALSNSVRHASATHRSVSLTKTDDSIRLRITDNGKGFDPGRKHRRGHGLANMAARARTIGAQYTLDSAPDHGTSITIDIPTGNPHAC